MYKYFWTGKIKDFRRLLALWLKMSDAEFEKKYPSIVGIDTY